MTTGRSKILVLLGQADRCEELAQALIAARRAVRQGERDGVSHAQMLLLLSCAHQAWEAWESRRPRAEGPAPPENTKARPLGMI